MIPLELLGQLPAPALDAGPPRRPAPVQGRIYADNLPYWPESRIAVGTFREPDPKGVTEMVFQGSVVGLLTPPPSP
jgi:hypothetical protein